MPQIIEGIDMTKWISSPTERAALAFAIAKNIALLIIVAALATGIAR